MANSNLILKIRRLATFPLRTVRVLRRALVSLEGLDRKVSALDDALRLTISDRVKFEREIVAYLAARDAPDRIAGMKSILTELAAQSPANAARIEELGTVLDALLEPNAIEPAQRLVAMLIARGNPLPDDIHEHALRVQIRENPFEASLIYSLTALLMRLDRPPVPDAGLMPAAGAERPNKLTIEELLRIAGECAQKGDTVGVYAALWQIVLFNPTRGWAEYARAFADRAEWANCRAALQQALASYNAGDTESVKAVLYALAEAVSKKQAGNLDWETWVDRLPPSLRSSPDMLVLLVACGAVDRAATLLPAIERDVGKRADASLAACTTAFQQGQYEESYAYLMQALELDLPATLHRIIRDLSAQIANLNLVKANRGTSDVVRLIAKRTLDYDDVNLVPPFPSPESLLAMRRMRQTALDRGLPPAFLISQGKSASVSVGNIISGGFALPTVLHSLFNTDVVLPWARDFNRGGGIHMTHLTAFPRNVDLLAEAGNSNIIVLIRDPRQAMVSYLEHARKYRDEILPVERPYFEADNEAAIDYLIKTRIEDSINWIDQWNAAGPRLTVNFVTFEDFVGDHDQFVERLLALYGGDLRYFDRDAAFHRAEGTDFHRRLGSVDEWRQVLTASQIEQVDAMMPDYFWSKFNWSP